MSSEEAEESVLVSDCVDDSVAFDDADEYDDDADDVGGTGVRGRAGGALEAVAEVGGVNPTLDGAGAPVVPVSDSLDDFFVTMIDCAVLLGLSDGETGLVGTGTPVWRPGGRSPPLTRLARFATASANDPMPAVPVMVGDVALKELFGFGDSIGTP